METGSAQHVSIADDVTGARGPVDVAGGPVACGLVAGRSGYDGEVVDGAVGDGIAGDGLVAGGSGEGDPVGGEVFGGLVKDSSVGHGLVERRAIGDVARLAAEFAENGFVVLRGLVDGEALAAEFDVVLDDAFAGSADDHANAGSAGNRFRYVPVMTAAAPVSLATTVQVAAVVMALLGAPVLPGRTKATRYLTGTAWHRDSEADLCSVGVLSYLEPLDAESGALAVIPGSHRSGAPTPSASSSDVMVDGAVVLATEPGDVILFDEHLLHASAGGGRWRRQWRADFVVDDGSASSDPSDDHLRAYYAALHAPGWDGGYDIERYPSYGPAWRALDARWTRRLDELGAFAAAQAEERAALAARAAAASR